MRRHKTNAKQLAAALGISPSTVHHWMSGKSTPNMRSCKLLAEYGNLELEDVLVASGHLVRLRKRRSPAWPKFREYIREAYPDILDEDLITMIEDLIERERRKRTPRGKKKNQIDSL